MYACLAWLENNIKKAFTTEIQGLLSLEVYVVKKCYITAPGLP
jgi:hypothetical protein